MELFYCQFQNALRISFFIQNFITWKLHFGLPVVSKQRIYKKESTRGKRKWKGYFYNGIILLQIF